MSALAAFSAQADSIAVSGTSGTTYPGNDCGQGSANKGREIYSATISNDANNLYISLALCPLGNATSQGGFDYLMPITSGNPSAGGDSLANTNGNPYLRAVSVDSGFGGMTDMIGIYTPNGSSPYSFGFNDWVYTGSTWTQMNNYATGVTIVNGSGGNPTVLTLTAPLADFTNLNFTAGSTFDFDFDSTGTGAGQTAYGDLALPGPVQGGAAYTNGVAITPTDEFESPQDERAHQDLAEFRVLRHQRPQRVSAQLDKLARLRHASTHQTSLPGNHGHLTRESAWVVRSHHALAVQGWLHDFHLS